MLFQLVLFFFDYFKNIVQISLIFLFLPVPHPFFKILFLFFCLKFKKKNQFDLHKIQILQKCQNK